MSFKLSKKHCLTETTKFAGPHKTTLTTKRFSYRKRLQNLLKRNSKLLEIRNLTVGLFESEKLLLESFNLTIEENSVHVLVGPNGCGKSTLCQILVAGSGYNILSGGIFYKDFDITLFNKNQRADLGIFLAFQYPIEIPGISTQLFLETALKAKLSRRFYESGLNPKIIKKIITNIASKIKLVPEYLDRDLNEGFSGGERKRNELIQMLLLDKKIYILDELDSGLDFDGLAILADAINYLLVGRSFKSVKNLKKKCTLINQKNYYPPIDHKIPPSSKAVLVITHSPKFINAIFADFLHVMDNGKIKVTGDPITLTHLIEQGGFNLVHKRFNSKLNTKEVDLDNNGGFIKIKFGIWLYMTSIYVLSFYGVWKTI